MKYVDYLKTLTQCPFCKGIHTRILIENDGALLTYSLAPYHKYHLLVVPKRHLESILDLTWDEHVCIMALIVNGLKALGKIGHHDCTVLVRDYQVVGKSVPHLHYHIIPGGQIEDVSLNLEMRELLTQDEEQALIKELKNTVGLGGK
jgi:diadenosine tetraphosphate (Ap4A) HIT family hydrolase